MKKFSAVAAVCGMALSASAATTQPKVVFIGDYYTYLWTNAFTSNPTWINKGTDGLGEMTGGEQSFQTLARFQSDVVSLHPAVVHIMLGANDWYDSSPTSLANVAPSLESNLDQMVKEARAANIKVVLGLEPLDQEQNVFVTLINSVVQSYGAANNIPVVNYGDALCGCVLEAGTTSNTAITPVYLGTTADKNDQDDGGVVPNTTGYSLMTQMAQTAIATLTNTSLTLKSGYLQNVQLGDNNLGVDPPGKPNVNTVLTSAVVQFTPYGTFSDGSVHVLNNTNAQGKNLYGTWSSSNPLVMSISQEGLAFATTKGTAIIHFTSTTGHINEWVMTVNTR